MYNSPGYEQKQILEEMREKKARADAIISLARKKAEIIIQNSLKEAEEKFKVAYNEGFEKGYREGVKKGTDEGKRELTKSKNESIKTVKSLIENYEKELDKLLDGLQPHIIRLVQEIAQNLVQKEVEMDKDTIIRNIKSAGRKLTTPDKITVHVNPKDAPYVIDCKADIISQVANILEMEVAPQEDIMPGGCLINSMSGIIDATIPTRWDGINEKGI